MRLFKRKKTGEPTQAEFVPNQDFLDEGFRFLKGKKYTAEINKVRYFAGNGWTEGSTVTPLDAAVLNVNNSNHGHEGGF